MVRIVFFFTYSFFLYEIFNKIKFVLLGSHSGENFADLFRKVLDQFECTNQLFSITADNASTNNKMAEWIEKEVPTFNHRTHLLGCVAHVINLAAKSALSTFGTIGEDDEDHELPTSMMDVRYITNEPGRVNVNLKTVLKRVHGFSVFVRGSPQQRERFAQTVRFIQPDQFNDNITVLVLDVETRWNSTLHMFQRAMTLKKSYNHFCSENDDCHKFKLNDDEWEQVSYIIAMLEPLGAATELLCGSEYPTLNSALPIYLILIKRLTIIQNGLYNQGQLIDPAKKLFDKLNQYLQLALKKPLYICAMVMDPRFKMHFWKSQIGIIEQHCSHSLEDIQSIFIN